MDKEENNSQEYLDKRAFYRGVLTVYGRKPVLEALQNKQAKAFRLHLAESNKPAAIIDEIVSLTNKQGAEVYYHTRQELSRLSKNSKQDQGVCVDLLCPGFSDANQFLNQNKNQPFELIALDRVTNPQNLGMIIRSVTAGFCNGILLPETGTAQIDPLVIKASAGTVFRSKIIRCSRLHETLSKFKSEGTAIVELTGQGVPGFTAVNRLKQKIFVLGNETEGVSKEISKICDHSIAIPMNNNVESLNVAVTASLLAFRNNLAT